MMKSIKTRSFLTPARLFNLLLILIIIASCRRSDQAGQRQQGPALVKIYEISETPFVLDLIATGELLPDESAEIRAPLSGNVMKIHFKEGQLVKKGDLLVELDHRKWVAQRRGLEAQLASAQSELIRRESLVKVEGVSKADYEQAMAQVDQVKAQIEELDVLIDQARVSAPFSGQVGLRDFSSGSYMAQGALITRIVNTQRLKVRFTIAAKYSSLLHPGQTIQIRSNACDRIAEAVVYALDPALSPTSRTLEVRAYLMNPSGQFMAGDFVQIKLDLQQQSDAILIPPEAVIPELNQQVVFIVKDTVAIRRVVKTGTRTRDQIEITEGLKAGDKVILSGLMTLKDGAPVLVRTKDGEATK